MKIEMSKIKPFSHEGIHNLREQVRVTDHHQISSLIISVFQSALTNFYAP